MIAIRLVDWVLRRLLPFVCGILLATMIGFTIYTVVMRTVFLDPPFWGDTLALFANIWLVMLAFALSIRERESIALQIFADLLPRRAALALQMLWSGLFIALGAIMAIYGYQAADRIIGAYWELGNLPKSVPMMILPVSGVLIVAASLFVLQQDVAAWRRVADERDPAHKN